MQKEGSPARNRTPGKSVRSVKVSMAAPFFTTAVDLAVENGHEKHGLLSL